MLKERPLPEHSHTTQGVTPAPPKTVTAGTSVPLHRAGPDGPGVPLLTPCLYTPSLSGVLPHSSSSTQALKNPRLMINAT